MTNAHPSPTAPALSTDADVALAERRAAVDLIATTRTRMVRCSLYASFLSQAKGATTNAEQAQHKWLAQLEAQADALDRVIEVLKGHDPQAEVPGPVTDWIAGLAVDCPGPMQAIHKMQSLTNDLRQAATGDAPQTIEAALDAHMQFAQSAFFDAVSQFCDALWRDIDTARTQEIMQARETGDTITGTLKRLEHIGKHVRLVSLNASVEAARVGDAGKGLGVIAVEFKALAEEIQKLAETARQDIAALSHGASAS